MLQSSSDEEAKPNHELRNQDEYIIVLDGITCVAEGTTNSQSYLTIAGDSGTTSSDSNVLPLSTSTPSDGTNAGS